MKKSQLKNIIRESIKELMLNEQTPVFHFWYPRMDFNGASCSSTNLNYPNIIYSNVVSGGTYDGGSFGNPLNATASENIWNFLGSPSVGQNVKLLLDISSFPSQGNGYFSTAEVVCFEYGGASPTQTFNGVTLLNIQFLGVYSDCASCNASIEFGCTDPSAINQSYDPYATQDDGSCDYGWTCGPLPMGGAVAEQSAPMPTGCIPGTSTNIGQYATQGACLSQNTNIPNGCGGTSIGMKKSDPQIDRMKNLANIKKPDPQIDRMKNLANIKKQ